MKLRRCGSKRKSPCLLVRLLSSNGMKKRNIGVLVALSLFLTLPNLNGLSLGVSQSLRSPKDDSKPLDFEIGLNARVDSLLALDVEIERQEGKQYRNLEAFGWYFWKFAQVSGKYINIEEDGLENASIDVRARFKSYSLGIAETWDLHPEIMIVFGKDTRREFNFFGLVNYRLRLITNFYTNDFVSFNNETELTFNVKLLTWLSAFVRYKSRYYDQYKFSEMAGLELEL